MPTPVRRLDLDITVPVVLFKTSENALQHGPLGIIRSLGRLGVPVFAMIEDPLAPAAVSRHLKGSFAVNDGSAAPGSLIKWLGAIAERLGTRAILIPTDDQGAAFISEESEALGKWFIFPKGPKDLPRRLANKRDLYSFCKKQGVPCAESTFPSCAADVLAFLKCAKFPVIFKMAEPQRRPKGVRSVRIVYTPEELLIRYQQANDSGYSDVILQECISERSAEDWVFHGYVNPETNCMVGFTGKKLRSHPAFAGSTSLGVSLPNECLTRQAEALLRSLSYAGIMDIDYRYDPRDDQYKLLDFNPRVGANFRMFEDESGVDVVRALHLDLTGRTVTRSPEAVGRTFIVEPFELAAACDYLQAGELTLTGWWRTLKGRREFAWFSWNDPAPVLLMVIRTLWRAMKRLAVRTRRSTPESRLSSTVRIGNGPADIMRDSQRRKSWRFLHLMDRQTMRSVCLGTRGREYSDVAD